ncbi:MAG: DUF4912 domain-containing protein [Planctomycetota bacterium]
MNNQKQLLTDKKLTDNRIENLRGGCAFSPETARHKYVSMRSKISDSCFKFGEGEIEFRKKQNRTVADIHAGSSKFTQEELRGILNSVELKEFAPLNEAKLVLLEIGPYLIHAYWEIPDAKVRELKEIHGSNMDNFKMVVRFYEVNYCGTNDIVNQYDIEVEDLKSDWFNHVWSSGKKYIADVGFIFNDGTFKRLARSNAIQMPRDIRSDKASSEKLHVEENRALYSRPGIFRTAKAPENEFRPLSEIFNDIHAESKVRNIYNRLIIEGPRVLNTEKVIEPTPKSILIDEYRKKKLPALNDADKTKMIISDLLNENVSAVNNQVSVKTGRETAEAEVESNNNSGKMEFSDFISSKRTIDHAKTQKERKVYAFSAGLDVEEKPEPYRYWSKSVKRKADLCKTLKIDNSNKSSSDFSKGIDLSRTSVEPSADSGTNISDFTIEATLNIKGIVPQGMHLVIDGKTLKPDGAGNFNLKSTIDNGLVKIPYSLQGKDGRIKRSGEINYSLSTLKHHNAWDKLEQK